MASPHPSVKELMAQHSTAIAQLLADNKDFANTDIGVPFDDLFVLRYLLSAKGDVKTAGKKLRETLEWRSNNLETLNLAARGVVPHKDRVSQFTKDGVYGWLGATDLLYVVRFGLADTAAAMAVISEDDMLENLMYSNEKGFRLVDQRTRDTGEMCKIVSLVDLHGFSLARFSRKFSNVVGKNSHANNIYYPQLLRCSVMFNLPTVVRMVIKATNLLMSKETVEKQRVCPGRPGGKHQTAADCPFLRAQMGDGAVKMLPPFLRGTAPVPAFLQHESDK